MSTTDLSGAARLLLLLGMQLGRAQSSGTSSPLLSPRGDGASLLGPVTPGQLLDQSLGLTPGMTPCEDPTSLVDQILEDLFNNGQDNNALSLLNNQSMSEILAMLLTLAGQADQQLNQLGQNPMCPSRGLGNPFLSGGMPCLNPFGQPNWAMDCGEDGGSSSMSMAAYMELAASFSGGCLAPGANFGYGGSFASSMFFGMEANFGYGCAGGDGSASYCVGGGGGGHVHHRGGGCIGQAGMNFSYCEYAEEYNCEEEYDCEGDDDCSIDCNDECEDNCSMDCEMDCSYECEDDYDCDVDCSDECDDICEDNSDCCVDIDVEVGCETECDDGGGCEDDC